MAYANNQMTGVPFALLMVCALGPSLTGVAFAERQSISGPLIFSSTLNRMVEQLIGLASASFR